MRQGSPHSRMQALSLIIDRIFVRDGQRKFAPGGAIIPASVDNTRASAPLLFPGTSSPTGDRITQSGWQLIAAVSRPHRSIASRFLALVCVGLVAFASFAQATHVHSSQAKAPHHECSICSVAHAAVLARAPYRAAPMPVRRASSSVPLAASQSNGFVSSLRIRPPPSQG